MPFTSSMFLVFGFLLSFSDMNLSTAQKWGDFKKKQITSSGVVQCSLAMSGEKQETQSFIHTHPRILENICKGVTGKKNIRSSKEFTVSTCKKQCNTTCSYGEAEVQRGRICLTCRNRKPVQFIKMGACDSP